MFITYIIQSKDSGVLSANSMSRLDYSHFTAALFCGLIAIWLVFLRFLVKYTSDDDSILHPSIAHRRQRAPRIGWLKLGRAREY